MKSKLSGFFQMISNIPDDFKTVRIFQMTAKFPNDFEFRFFGNVVRGKSALFRLVVRNGYAHFVRKVFFAPLGIADL